MMKVMEYDIEISNTEQHYKESQYRITLRRTILGIMVIAISTFAAGIIMISCIADEASHSHEEVLEKIEETFASAFVNEK
mmetsp:Transcript_23191/g.30011  ORF Transcript_23191/g.30011 Transcript_23191/m.30011 type:complete len:80 (+) Transcript_23191:119-358(+)